MLMDPDPGGGGSVHIPPQTHPDPNEDTGSKKLHERKTKVHTSQLGDLMKKKNLNLNIFFNAFYVSSTFW